MKFIFTITLLLVSIAGLLYVEHQAEAQALQLAKAYTGKVNKAIASTIVKKIESRGFAANDPIYAATLQSTEAVLNTAVAAGTVATTVAAIGSSPVWLSVALGIGAAYEIYDWTMGQYEFKADPATKKVTLSTVGIAVTPAPPPANTSYNTLSEILPIDYSDPGVGNQITYPSDLPLCADFKMSSPPVATLKSTARICGVDVASLQGQADHFIRNQYIYDHNLYGHTLTFIGPSWGNPTKINCTINNLICPQGTNYQYAYSYNLQGYFNSGNPFNRNVVGSISVFNNPSYIQPGKQVTLNDAVAKLTEPDLNTRADPVLIAAVANKLWQQAAQQPGYQGAAYNPAEPVTEQDILDDINAGLYPWPTVADLLTAISTSPQTQAQLDPAIQPVEATNPGMGQQVQLDLGPDPGIGQPALETSPTGASIVQHIMGLLPSLSAFTIPPHTSQCEAPTFDFFGNSYSLQSMCDLLESQRALLSTIFGALWGIFALTLVLRT